MTNNYLSFVYDEKLHSYSYNPKLNYLCIFFSPFIPVRTRKFFYIPRDLKLVNTGKKII